MQWPENPNTETPMLAHEEIIRAEEAAFERKMRHDRIVADIKKLPVKEMTVGELVQILEAIDFTPASKEVSFRHEYQSLRMKRTIRESSFGNAFLKATPIRAHLKKRYKY